MISSRSRLVPKRFCEVLLLGRDDVASGIMEKLAARMPKPAAGENETPQK